MNEDTIKAIAPEEWEQVTGLLAAQKHCEGDGWEMGKCSECPTGDLVCCTGDGPPTEQRVIAAQAEVIAKLAAAVEELRTTGDAALFAEREYTRALLDPAGSPETRNAAAERKNEVLVRWRSAHDRKET